MPVLKVTSNGIDFNVRMLYEGETYGLNEQFIHNKADPLVEFYDTRYPHTPYGQLINRYSLNTLLERQKNVGINLDGGVPDWRIDANTTDSVINWLSSNKQKPLQKKKM